MGQPIMNFNSEYKKITHLIKDDLNKIENNLTDFFCGSQDLQDNLVNIIKAPSKRLRPVLAILYLKMYGVEVSSQHTDIQSAVELIHNATLIHDDVIDKSSKRRNQKTLNETFDNSLAVITGDFLLTVAIQKLLSVNSANILSTFNTAIKKMCLGEINQYFNLFKLTEINEYIDKCQNKTAELFMASLTSSAEIAQLDITQANDFARNFGIAFQIRDDLLNVIQNNTDKPIGNDIEAGIYTAPMIFAKNTENIDYGIEKTKELLDNYFNQAKKCLDKAPENKFKQAIITLIDLLKICK